MTVVTRNYVYGCRRPGEASTIIAQMDAANKYRSRLVDIELRRREESLRAARRASPAWANASDVCDRLSSVMATSPSDSTASQLREARSAEKVLRAAAYAAITADESSAINERAYEEVRKARESCGLYWGTYLLVEQAADNFRKGAPPRCHRFDGTGRVGVQLQGGLSVGAAMGGGDTRLRIIAQDCGASSRVVVKRDGRRVELPRPLENRRQQYRDVWLRIGSDGRSPIWARVPIIYDRPLPDGAWIKWAILRRNLVGGKERWSLCLVCSVPEASLGDPRRATSGAVGIDVGYRVMPDGSQRVAVAVGSDGETFELRLPAGIAEQFAKCEDIRSIRDRLFNEARDALREWLSGREDLPGWLNADAATLHAWRSSQRLSKLVYEWRRYRPHMCGEDAILERLTAWRDREEHLHQYESQLRDQLLAARKDIYRNWSAMLRRRYAVAYVEHMDLREALHDAPDVSASHRRRARFAGVSQLLQCVRESMPARSVDRSGTTRTCCTCGASREITAKDVRYVCSECGMEVDRDQNAARNILARGGMLAPDARSLADVSGDGLAAAGRTRKPGAGSERRPASRKRKDAA